MKTIGQAVSQIFMDNKYLHDDYKVTARYIWQKIRAKTLFFIKRKNDNFNLNNNNFIYTTLNCLEMELVDSIDCCIEIPSCKILKSKLPIPKIAESNLSSVIKGMYTVDGGERIDFVTINDVVRMGNSKYKPQGIKLFIKNNHAFIPFRETPKAISVEAFFENPEEVYFLNECGTKDFCISAFDMEWKVPSDLEDPILLEVNKDLYNIHNRIVPDENINKNEVIK